MSDKAPESIEVRNFQNEWIDVIYRKMKPIEESAGIYTPLAPCVTEEDGIRIERDVAVPMCDGTTIYTDIYRPDGATNVPAIIAWSLYGKHFGYASLARQSGVPPVTTYPISKMLFPPTSHLVPPGTTSPMAKFEAPDPSYWCHYGYAVINPDARGAGNSGGDVAFWGMMIEARDCYDLIEWIAARDWSNGRGFTLV